MAFVNPAPPSPSGLWIHTICWDFITTIVFGISWRTCPTAHRQACWVTTHLGSRASFFVMV